MVARGVLIRSVFHLLASSCRDQYKNCCSPLTASEKQQEAEWRAYDKEWGAGAE
jgi:hypothetical protein